MPKTDPNDTTGREADSDVHEGNDGFSAAFDTLAAGGALEASSAQDENAEDADADAGQDGADADESPQNNGDGKDPPAKAPADAAAGKAPDPWANATPEQIAERDKLKTELEAERRRTAGASGRASGLQRELNALKAHAQAGTSPASTSAGKGEERSDAQKALDAEIAALKEDYPEVAGPLIRLLEAQRADLAELRGQVAPIAEADEQEAIAVQTQALEAQHPDWRHFGTLEEPHYLAWIAAQPNAAAIRAERTSFLGWLGAQPPTVQALADSMDAREVSVAISLFKSERARAAGGSGDPEPKDTATDARRQRQLEGGSHVGSRAGSAASGAPDDFTSAFEHFAKGKKA